MYIVCALIYEDYIYRYVIYIYIYSPAMLYIHIHIRKENEANKNVVSHHTCRRLTTPTFDNIYFSN